MALTLEIVWFDEDVIELRVRCDNGRFSGTADCYAGYSIFDNFSSAVGGFPISCDDRREFELGSFTSSWHRGLRLKLMCVDRAGHAIAVVRIRNPDGSRPISQVETAELWFPVEPAAIDEFVASLGKMQVAVSAAVTLQQAI